MSHEYAQDQDLFDAVIVLAGGHMPSKPKDFRNMECLLTGINLKNCSNMKSTRADSKQSVDNQQSDNSLKKDLNSIEKELQTQMDGAALQIVGKFYGTTSSDYYYQVYCKPKTQVPVRNAKKNFLISYTLQQVVYDDCVLVTLPHKTSHTKTAPKFSKARLLSDITYSHRSNGCNGWRKPL